MTGPVSTTDRHHPGRWSSTPSTDRGFSAGVRLWQSTVNRTTGICGRTVVLRSAEPAAPTPALTALPEVWRRVTLGLITLPGCVPATATSPNGSPTTRFRR